VRRGEGGLCCNGSDDCGGKKQEGRSEVRGWSESGGKIVFVKRDFPKQLGRPETENDLGAQSMS